METKLKRIAKRAQEDAKCKFTSLAYLLNEESLAQCFWELKKGKAPGVDGVTLEEYGKDVAENLRDLVKRMKAMKYRPQPVRRVYIPKDSKGKRPLGIPALEDKIVQIGMTKILEAIFEKNFLDVSYGFRPKRGCHEALGAVNRAFIKRPISYVVDADIKAYFDNVDHKWLVECLRQRISDPNFIRLIVRFLKSGVMEEGRYYDTEKGTPQGGSLSPILSNIYLHYVLDLWVEKQLKKQGRGYVEEIRYADDFIICVQYKEDGKKAIAALEERLAKFGLSLSKEKTRLIEFGRYAEINAKRQGKKPATFDFLGFTHYCGRTRKGKFKVDRRTSREKFRVKVKAMNSWLKSARNSILLKDLWKLLKTKLLGHYHYYGVSGNFKKIQSFYYQTVKLIFKWLNRRSQKRSFNWKSFNRYLELYPLPKPKIYHNLYTLSSAFGSVTEEPYEGNPHVRFCEGHRLPY